MTILVTGAAGFIGSHVSLALLDAGEHVIGIDNLNDYYDPTLKEARIANIEARASGRFAFEKLDFADAEALNAIADRHEVDRIIHLGAQAGVRYSLINPHAYVQSNLVGHVNMLELARRREVKHLVYASSSSVYGGNDNLPFRVEDRVDRPLSLYAATKKSDELLSESYASMFRLPQTGLRFFTVYGPWGRPDMAMFIFTKALYEGRSLPLFNEGKMRRDFTYIDDIVDGIVSCFNNPPVDDRIAKAGGSTAPHAIYNIGNSRSEELGRVIDLLARETGREPVLEMLPLQKGDVTDTFADISAIQRDHGFEPRTSIDEGVPRFVDWYRNFYGVNA